jgi:Xaa-Pro aminopeptidase
LSSIPGDESEVDGGSTVDDVQNRGQVVAARLDMVRTALLRRGLAAVLLTGRRNFAWLTAGGVNHVEVATDVGPAALFVTPNRAVVLAPVNEADRLVDEELPGTDLQVEVVPWELTADSLRNRSPADGPVGDDASVEADLMPARAILHPFETDRMAWLGRIATSSIEAALADPTGGTELELAGDVLRRLTIAGVRAPVLLVAADDRIRRYRHPLPSSASIRSRAMAVLVAERWGLHVALTRFHDPQPLDGDLARRRAAVGLVLDAMLDASRPDSTLGEVFLAGARVYERTGFAGDVRLHHQGGVIGYRSRERVATPDDTFELAPGMAVAWNPSVAGAKAEATAAICPDGGLRQLA